MQARLQPGARRQQQQPAACFHSEVEAVSQVAAAPARSLLTQLRQRPDAHAKRLTPAGQRVVCHFGDDDDEDDAAGASHPDLAPLAALLASGAQLWWSCPSPDRPGQAGARAGAGAGVRAGEAADAPTAPCHARAVRSSRADRGATGCIYSTAPPRRWRCSVSCCRRHGATPLAANDVNRCSAFDLLLAVALHEHRDVRLLALPQSHPAQALAVHGRSCVCSLEQLLRLALTQRS